MGEEKFGGINHIGERKKDVNGVLGEYEFKTFSFIFQKARRFGSGILNLDLAPKVQEYEDYSLNMIGIYAQNCEDWYVCIQATAMYGLTIVSMYDTLGKDTVSYVLK